jgi:hypothetical protein
MVHPVAWAALFDSIELNALNLEGNANELGQVDASGYNIPSKDGDRFVLHTQGIA